jgi:cell division protein FtsB
VPKKPVTNRPTPKARSAAPSAGSRFDRAGDESRAQAETERGNWLRGIRFSGFTVLMLAVIVLGVVVLAPNLKAYIEQRQQIAALQQTVDDSADKIEQLTAERQRWNDSTYVTTQARDRLFYAARSASSSSTTSTPPSSATPKRPSATPSPKPTSTGARRSSDRS